MELDLDYIKVIVSVSIAVLGWIIAHYFTSRRDSSNKRRDVSIEHLVNAYRVLTNEVSHREPTPERRESLENILSDIQLFGSSEQVNLAKQLAIEVAAGGTFELDPLINSLRHDLRSQLKLSAVEGNVKWLRFSE